MKDLEERLSLIYREDVKISSENVDKTGRVRVLYNVGQTKRYSQLARLVLEYHLGRPLSKDETVDHIDGDCQNDDPSNLRVLSLSENASDSVMRLHEQSFSCGLCDTHFVLSGRKLGNAVHNRRQGKSGPFCSKQCAGRYSALVGHGLREEIDVVHINRTYSNRKGQEKRK